MDKRIKNTVDVSNTTLVEPGKSKRLLEMHNLSKALPNSKVVDCGAEWVADKQNSNISPALLLARQLIDQRLTEILESLPPGKKQRLFKIRFGVDLERIPELPITQVLRLFNIHSPELSHHLANIKRLGDLNYNGQSVNS